MSGALIERVVTTEIQSFRLSRRLLACNSPQAWRNRPRRASELRNTSIPLLQPQAASLVVDLRSQLRSQDRCASTFASESKRLHRTGLHELHIAHGAKMVPFAGYSMPVLYSDLSVGESHKWTREKASLFDVGHMVQHRLSGPLASSLLEKITPTSIGSLETNHSTLSCLLHPTTGGIVDDTVITRLGPESFYMVTNAACHAKDCQYLEEQILLHLPDASTQSAGIRWQVLEDMGLIALQGPLSADILQELLAHPEEINIKKLYFGQCAFVSLRLLSGDTSVPLLISRGGYTGEDGFEISIPPEITAAVTESLLQSAGKEKLRLAGLGARDSLRLEAGMCLYGHDLNDSTTPVEAGLSWIISKERRTSGRFHGAEIIQRQLRPKKDGGSGVTTRRVGLVIEGAPAREGAEVIAEACPADHLQGEVIGKVTSGCPSPTLGKNIAMAYVTDGWHKAGTEVGVIVRGKRRKAKVVKMPFIQSKYWKQAAGTAPS